MLYNILAECLDGSPLRVVQWGIVIKEGRCPYRLRSCLDDLDRSVPVGVDSPQVPCGHHERVAFGTGSEIGSEESRVQPGKAVVVSIDAGNPINDQDHIGAEPSPRLPDFLDVIAAQSDIREYEHVRKELFISQRCELAEELISICAQPLNLSDGWCVGNLMFNKEDPEANRWGGASAPRQDRCGF